MRILISTPSLGLHGGIRNIIDLANLLQAKGHDVILYVQSGHLKTNDYKINCRVVNNTYLADRCDRIVISSPHGIELMNCKPKKILWMQMIEHLFRPTDLKWLERCKSFYFADAPMISTATWGVEYLKAQGRVLDTYVLGTGVNLDNFPISTTAKTKEFVLLESPVPTNPVKDADYLALKAGKKLREQGLKVIAYGALPLPKEYSDCVDSYHLKPSLQKMNELYLLATLLIKATKYDFRSTACLEAMTKGCVSVRGIMMGDEDLTDENSYKQGYGDLYNLALHAINDENLNQKSLNCINYIMNHSWSYWLPKYEEIICG